MKAIFVLFPLLSGFVLLKMILTWPDTRLHVVQCDVGQGDAILITKGFSQILVDTGKGNEVMECLEKYVPFWDRHLSAIVITHKDTDHSGGVDEVLQSYSADTIVINSSSEEMIHNNTNSINNKAKIVNGNDIQELKIDDIIMQILSYTINNTGNEGNSEVLPDKQTKEDSAKDFDNERSLVTRLSYGVFSTLMLADVDAGIEEKLVQKYDLASTVLKVGHHGSRFSTCQALLTEVKPFIATIGVGKNSYGHPHRDTLATLAQHGVEVYRTDIDGDIMITSDGKAWWVEKRR